MLKLKHRKGEFFMKFVIPGKPIGKQRPRFFNKCGQVTVYTPRDTLQYEKKVLQCFNQSIIENPTDANIGPFGSVIVRINAYYGIPKSWSKKKRELAEQGQIRPQVKPDIDNVAKIILDGLNGQAYKDDSQVIELITSKSYTAPGEDERVEVELYYI